MPFCPYCGKELSEEAKFCPNCGAPIQPSTTTAPPQPPPELERGVTLADWGERFLAWLIDIIIVGAVSGILNLPGLNIPMMPFVTFGSRDFIQFLYWALMEGYTGQSIGKMAMHLKTTKIDGTPATLLDAGIESFGKAFLLPIDCIIGWVAESCKERKQRLFSMLSKTIVVKVTRR